MKSRRCLSIYLSLHLPLKDGEDSLQPADSQKHSRFILNALFYFNELKNCDRKFKNYSIVSITIRGDRNSNKPLIWIFQTVYEAKDTGIF